MTEVPTSPTKDRGTAQMSVGAPTRSEKRYRRERYWPFVLPAVTLIVLFKLYPSVMGVYYSLTNWTGFGQAHFIGLSNYDYLFHNHDFLEVLLNNLKLVIALPVFVLIPLLVALLIWGRPWGHRFLKAAYFFPAILSPVIIGGMFGGLLQVSGPLDSLVRTLIPSFDEDWLGDPHLTVWVMIGVVLWANFGIGVLVYLSALASVPVDLLEAITLDGGGWWRTLWHVVLPTLKNVISFWSVIVLITLFTSLFGFIFSLSGGGPGITSTMLEYDIYIYAFSNQQYGIAAAIGVVLLVITGVFTALQLRLTMKAEDV